jgi:quinol monooxygenase YgiN
MEHARVSLVTADPAQVDELVRYVTGDVRKVIEDHPGSRGMALLVIPELAVVVFETFWVTGDAMRDSEKTEEPLREETVRRGRATVSVERHEVASSVRSARLREGAGVRLTRVDIEPSRVDAAIADYEDTALPWLIEAEGFCSALLLVHRRSGRAMVETVWRDGAAMAASRSAAAAARADAIAATGGVIRALEEFRLEFNSAPFS